MVNPEILRQYAELAVRAGVHIQPEFPECEHHILQKPSNINGLNLFCLDNYLVIYYNM